MDDRIIIAKLNAVRGLMVRDCVELRPWEARTATHEGPDRYTFHDDWHPVTQPSRWPAGVTVFVRSRASLPAGWPTADSYLSFAFEDMEGLLWLDGQPYSGLDWGHTRCPVPREGELELVVEFDCVPRARHELHLRGSTGVFHGASLVWVDRAVEAAYYDLRFAHEAYHALPEGRRKELLGLAIEDAMVAFTLEAPRETVLQELALARRLLAERLAEIAPDPESGRLFLTGHTHIDTAWLWPIRETIRKCGRTFATAAWLMERYPQFHFSCSQAQLYDFTRKHYPTVYEQMKRWVQVGRWETTGAMWVEADCNVTSGEALIRQILHGLSYFRREFGTRPTVCWLPDVFGYNAGLPQILVGCGLRSFWTWKLHWQSRNSFPYHLFWWQGVDGSRVLAHIPKLGGGGYNGTPSPQQLATAWQTYLQKGTYDEQLFPFGYGDGGGGVNEEMLEFAQRARAFPGLPACRQGTAEDFFEEVHATHPDLPIWVGELYLETHRGTLTSQARIKRDNRRCELTLRGAEIAGVIARRLGVDVDLSPLRAAWEKTLLHQFHDILPGSSIGEVYQEAAQDHAQVLATAEEVRNRALATIIGDAKDTLRFAVLNSLSWERDGVVEIEAPDVGETVVGMMHGHPVPAQVVAKDGKRMTVLVAAEKVPAMGGALLELALDAPLPSLVHATDRTLENQFHRLELDQAGEILSLWDKRAEREVIAPGERGNQLLLFQDGPEREAAWNVHWTYNKRRYSWDEECTVRAIEHGPVRATIRVEKRRGNTRLVQDISLYDHKPRIDFRTWVDWRERQTMLKVAFPLAVHTDKAAYEVQFGVLERPTHRNTPWDQERFEVAAQRWADLSEGGYGVALLNDCKYGHDAHGNVLRLTLLRGPQYPDPNADLGEHEFTYSLLPHPGDWRQGEAVRHGWELNVPLFAVPTDIQREPISFLGVKGPAIVEALKPAEDGDGDILRVYEPHGGRGRVIIEFNFPVHEVIACNLAEENQGPVPFDGRTIEFPILPFQIRSFRLR